MRREVRGVGARGAGRAWVARREAQGVRREARGARGWGRVCFVCLYLLLEKLFRITPLPPPSTCSAAEPTHPTAAQGHNELAYKCWYAQLDAYSNAATVILAGERRRHSVDSRIAMRRTACPDARLGALLWCRRKASGRAAQARPSG